MLKTLRLTSLLKDDPLMRYNKRRIERLALVWHKENEALEAQHVALRVGIDQGMSRARLEVLRNRAHRHSAMALRSGKEVEAVMKVLRYRMEVLSRRVGFQATVLIPFLREDPAWGYELVYNPSRPKTTYRGITDSAIRNFDPGRSVLSQLGCF